MPEAFPSNALEYLAQNLPAIGPELHLVVFALLGCLGLELLPGDNRRWGSYFALLGIGFSGFHLYRIYASNQTGVAFDGMVAIDNFAIFFKLLFLLAAALTVIISIRFLDIEREQCGEYYAMILFATIGMMIMAAGVDLLTIYIGLELMAISFYVLVGIFRESKHSNEAAIKLFLLGAFSSGILLYGISLLYGLTGSTNLVEISDALAGVGGANPGLLTVAVILLIAGIGFKVAAVPFHMWAPDTYQGAPTAVTAFLSVGSKAAAFAIFLRIFVTSLQGSRAEWLVILAVLAMASLVVGNLAALIQSNVKRLLAYSSISHAGYILMGLVAGPEHNGVKAACAYIFIYVFMNMGAFAVLILLRRKNIPGEQISDFNGLMFTNPGIAIMTMVFMLSLAGIPPTAGFIAKYMVFASIIDAYLKTQSVLLLTLAVVGALAAVIGLYYYWQIVRAMFTSESEVTLPLSFSTGMIVALAVSIGATLWIGLYPDPMLNLAEFAALTLRF